MKKHISTKEEVLKKIMSKINKSDNGCSIYTGYINTAGYGVVKIGGRNGKYNPVHRFIYENCVGNIPIGMCVCHKCDNPPCCNPDHLFLGTQKEELLSLLEKKVVCIN